MRVVPSLLAASLGLVLVACQPAQAPAAGSNDARLPRRSRAPTRKVAARPPTSVVI